MFVSRQRLRSNPKSIFIDKPLPMGSYRESAATPILDRCLSPNGSGAYKNIFEMRQGKVFGNESVRLTVTPAQNRLLKFCSHLEAPYIAKHLETVHDLATYFTPLDQVCQDSSYCTKELQEIIKEISDEELSEINSPST